MDTGYSICVAYRSLTVLAVSTKRNVCARTWCLCVAGRYKSTVALCHRLPPPAGATVESQLAHSPATRIDILRRCCRRRCSVAVFFQRSFQFEINYRKYLDLFIIRTPDCQSNFMVKKSAYYIRSFTVIGSRCSTQVL